MRECEELHIIPPKKRGRPYRDSDEDNSFYEVSEGDDEQNENQIPDDDT